MNTLERVLLCLFSPYLMFFIIDNRRGLLSYQIRQLHCRARGARGHNLFSHLPFRMDNFVHGNDFFFPLIDRLVCRIQSSHTVDASIKYVAYYCIVYSGQVEIRLSVLQPVGYYSVKVLVYFTFRFIEFIIFKQREFGALHTQYLHAHASIQIVHK